MQSYIDLNNSAQKKRLTYEDGERQNEKPGCMFKDCTGLQMKKNLYVETITKNKK